MSGSDLRQGVRSDDGTTISFVTVGTGPALLIVGGALADSQDYMPLARSLAARFTVHVIDRRGRGGSGPQRLDHNVETEVADILAVRGATGARCAFGHSFGGLVCLEAARRSTELERIAVYEPGVSIDGSVRTDWIPRYRQLLAAGDTRGAFATMVRSAGFAPAALNWMPLWCTKLILGLGVRGDEWRRKESLLASHAVEHELLASVTDAPARYAGIAAQVLVVVGGRSPGFSGADLLEALTSTIPGSTGCTLDGLSHAAPAEDAPEAVARVLLGWLA